jgi:hypothetical protein
MPIDSSVAELITAELFVLMQEAPDPIFFYINSTGIAVSAMQQQQQQQQQQWALLPSDSRSTDSTCTWQE